MTQTINPFRNVRVEFHILQSFPVTCLNRDDVGAPKTAVVGGNTRARVSSQCWKRQVRLAMHELGIPLATRTKLIGELVKAECIKLGANETNASLCGSKVEQVFIKGSDSDKKSKKEESEDAEKGDEKSDTLLFLSPTEVKKLAEAFAKEGFEPDKVITSKKQAKEIADIIGKPNYSIDGFDIALFGRMVAQAATMNVEAAASFAHAISTHRVTNEVEFFTALDDELVRKGISGSGHMGSIEFNSATYYRYISLDIGQLYENMAGQLLPDAIDAFIKALYIAIPSARQATQSGASPWEYAKVFVRKGQRLQVPFETAVKPKDGGFIDPSKEFLNQYLSKKESLSGSLFGKIDSFSFGDDERYSIDNLANDIKNSIAKVHPYAN